MKKKTIQKFGKKYFLLGKRKEDNKKVWLEDFSWDCNWYWGGGYIEVFNNTYTDINEHSHFTQFQEIEKNEWIENKLYTDIKKVNYKDGLQAYFEEMTLSDSDLWKLCEYMESFYRLRESAEFFKHGASYTTTDLPKNDEYYQKMNTYIEQEIIPRVRGLFD